MMKRLSMSLLVIAAVSLMVGSATYALFTATSSNINNTFTTGTVSFGDDFVGGFSIDNIAPGDSGSEEAARVTYVGSLKAYIGINATVSGDLFEGTHPLDLTLSAMGTDVAADGNTYAVGIVENGAEIAVTADWSFPLEAGNEYQGKSGEVNFVIKAVQHRNNDNGAEPIAWD